MPGHAPNGIAALGAANAHADHSGPLASLFPANCDKRALPRLLSVRVLLIVLDIVFGPLSGRGQKQIELIKRRVVALSKAAQVAVVMLGSGLCPGGRIPNSPKALPAGRRHGLLCVGHQANGANDGQVQRFKPCIDHVEYDGQRYDIRAQVHTIGGYSALADQDGLAGFVTRMIYWPSELRVVYGELEARQLLKRFCSSATA